jgi:hypothetical protein
VPPGKEGPCWRPFSVPWGDYIWTWTWWKWWSNIPLCVPQEMTGFRQVVHLLCTRWGPMSQLTNLDPLHAKLIPICHLLALLRSHHILHISRIRVKQLILCTYLHNNHKLNILI